MYAEDRKTIVDRREMLRVKIKSLAEEARIIRREEHRSFGILREQLYLHRIGVVRRAAREAHIAYGLIRGRTFDQIEPARKTEPDWPAIRKLLTKYGPTGAVELLKAA